MRKLPSVLVFLCLSPFAVPLGAQTASPAPAAPVSAGQPQTIHLDVLVKDKNSGKLLSGLPAQAFTVMDNGQPAKLESFKPVDPDANPDAVQVLIVMDMINASANAMAWGREQLSEFLQHDGGSLHHRTSIAAITEDGPIVMNGFSTDGNQLQAEFRTFATHVRLVTQAAGWIGLEQLWDQSLAQFNEILAREFALPGRKLVLFISPGWPMMGGIGSTETVKERRSDFGMIMGMTNSIRDARTAIYLIDPIELGGNDTGNHNPFYYQDFLKPMTNPSDATYPYLGLGVFATHSGGQVLVTGKDIAGEIDSAMRDAGAYYELTYPAPPAGGPNQYHAINVRTNQPGASVQTLAGYYADMQHVGPELKKKR